GGEVRISSEQGKWTRFELAVPTTLVLISAFIVRASDWRYAINVGQIVELLYVKRDDILGPDGRRNIDWRGSTIPLVELKYLLGLGGARVFPEAARNTGALVGRAASNSQPAAGLGEGKPGDVHRVPVFITRAADRNVAVAVEQFQEQREIIVKSLGSIARKIKGIIGAVDLEGGDVALVLDLPSLLLLRSLRM
ncbi:MAG TPA: chemotaxis protein CheW, partial [Blastocatellia bacterium]